MENKQFFDPYNFSNSTMQPTSQPSLLQDDTSFLQASGITPTMFYQQQYWYYSYLSKMMEYKIKAKEYEILINKNK